MAKSSIYNQQLKEMQVNNLSSEDKKEYRLQTVDNIFSQLTDKTNRYIFYCPDMAIVNNLVKLIYETAYEVETLGYNVVILHEINGFKCKWLLESEEYKYLEDLNIDYIIKKKSSKSKKTKAIYSFKPSDTLIVPDQFQEIIDNLAEVKLIQKIVLVSSYTGLSALAPGLDYSVLGIKKLLFTEEQLKKDYTDLFNVESFLIDHYPINENVFIERRNVKEIYPTVCISNVGNNELTQEVINVFHAKYPNLRTFSFKLLSRDNWENYTDCLKHSALLLVLDRNMGNNQLIYEALSMGLPVGTISRRECSTELLENIFFGSNAFEIAESLAHFCENWLKLSTNIITDAVVQFKNTLGLSKFNYDSYQNQLRIVFEDLQLERVKYFAGIKQSIEKVDMSEK